MTKPTKEQLEHIHTDGRMAAQRGYGLERNPYRTATRDASGRAHPRPSGFDAMGDAWEAGWREADEEMEEAANTDWSKV
jgi:hypothetical protein